ncbi:hypothetical protein COV39_02720, partial [Candidatus Berkelbacteria bacterium CG11_big_fil_rev_8_21_14_0_20_40_23]
SSSTESKALRIGDPEITDWIPVFTGMTREGCGNDTFFVILNRKRSASDWGSSPSWIPAFAGMTEGGTGMTKGKYGNDKRNKNNDR